MAIDQTILFAASNYYQSSLNKQASDGRTYRTAFLCHSHLDEQLVKGLIVEFSRRGVKLYVDWLDTSMPDTPNKETAVKLQLRIKQADMFLFLATRNSMHSRWCPWEIGYADGIGKVPHILPTVDQYSVTHGSEYLELYPRIDIFPLYSQPFMIFEPGNGFKEVLR